MWNSPHQKKALTKAEMLAALPKGCVVIASRMGGKNTLDYTDSKCVRRIRLHETDIITIKTDGVIVLDNGGWNTVTSRSRMNEFTPLRVHAAKGYAWVNGVPFKKTVTVNTVTGAIESDIPFDAGAELTKKIDKYMKAWRQQGLPEDSKGDPWIPHPQGGKIDSETILGWIEDCYVFRSLYFWAEAFRGSSEQRQAFHARTIDSRGLSRHDCATIRRYLNACLGRVA